MKTVLVYCAFPDLRTKLTIQVGRASKSLECKDLERPAHGCDRHRKAMTRNGWDCLQIRATQKLATRIVPSASKIGMRRGGLKGREGTVTVGPVLRLATGATHESAGAAQETARATSDPASAGAVYHAFSRSGTI